MHRSILFWLLVSSGLAFFWPAESLGFDPFVTSKTLLWALVTITMFSLGTLVRADELRPLRQHPWWVALGVAAQVVIMPAAAWLVTKVVPMEPELAAGVILVGCVPGAMASNVLTHTARGSVAYSVSLTTVATLLSPFTVPVVISIVAGASTETSANSAMMLAVFVALPTVIGYFCSRKFKAVSDLTDKIGPAIAAIALLWIIASVVASSRAVLKDVGGILILALLVMNATGYAAGYFLGRVSRLPESFRRALSLEVGMQNAGLGTALAVSLYGQGTIATIPTAAYTFGCMLTGTLLATVWRRQSKQSSQQTGEET